MKKSNAQPWLQEIYRNPQKYIGHILAISDHQKIVLIADSFLEAKEKNDAMKDSFSNNKITYFGVPETVNEIFI